MFELEGKVKEVFDEQTFGSGFRKREFVVTVEDGKYPQDIKFECVQDKIQQLDNVSADDTVKVKFDIRGREWKGNYFVNLSAWQVNSVSGGDSAPDSIEPASQDEPPDDIPF
ncbi:DUF3127 domain-containing protein [Puniceicoccus vermicola]|uniref:DUF3127 domain-containing protein n=1 Tax=Puniceicoccus vermicola TaxID=388746 RepID=A0A7X1AVW2_9BACT|nr:DUF3127 domain-containing protein [Puniceicoccus vermicola]MBC2600729.1 DUF3127 domain-containing protein [Puniceicoccus vermicola]